MTTQSPTTRVYPGLLDSNIEFFNSDDGLKVISNSQVINFKDLPPIIYNMLSEKMHSEHEAIKILNTWCPNSEVQQLRKFTKCRFGGLDFTPDISKNKLQDGEYWDCPNRGNCIGEGIVCKNIQYNNQELTTADLRLMKLLTSSETNETIASIIDVSFGQLHKLKKILYQKLNAQTRQCVSNVLAALNII